MRNLTRIGALGAISCLAVALAATAGAAENPCPPGYILVGETDEQYICRKLSEGEDAEEVQVGEPEPEPEEEAESAAIADSEEPATEEPEEAVFEIEAEPEAPARPPLDPEVAAASVEVGLEAYRSLDFWTAAAIWMPLAERGYVPAQRLMGQLYFDGTGVRINPVQALFWWTLAAGEGDQEAQSLLDRVALRRAGDPLLVARSLAEAWTPAP